jgi:hypothetical protein
MVAGNGRELVVRNSFLTPRQVDEEIYWGNDRDVTGRLPCSGWKVAIAMILRRLVIVMSGLSVALGLAGIVAPAAGAAPSTCFRGTLEGTVNVSDAPIFKTSSLTIQVGTGNTGDTFAVSIIDAGSPPKYDGTDVNNGITGWISEIYLNNVHCVPL